MWIDTHVMAAVPLTKHMRDHFLQHTLDTGVWDITQREFSRRQKQLKQQWRKATRNGRHADADDGSGVDDG